MISCAKRRRSIRYSPVGVQHTRDDRHRNSISILSQSRLGQREHDVKNDANHRKEHADIEHQRRSDGERRRSRDRPWSTSPS